MIKKYKKKKKIPTNYNFILILLVIALFSSVFILGQQNKQFVDLSDLQRLSINVNNRVEAASKGNTFVYRRLIDGRPVTSSDLMNPDLVAIMVENLDESRPQSGLDKAALIIEAPVEGNITRFLAIYPIDTEVAEIGPIRSARPYYLDWTEAFDALYIHVGGSPAALTRIARKKNFNLNEFFQGSYFWRSQDRYAPHNTYISSESYNKYLSQREFSDYADFKSWQYKSQEPRAKRGQSGQHLSIKFSNRGLADAMSWHYDIEENEYLRYQSGVIHYMKDSSMIKAKNIIMQYTETQVLDNVGRLSLRTLGQGPAVFFIDGQVIKGTWKKETVEQRTKYYNEQGQEIKFNAGLTWIEVVTDKMAIEY